MSERHCPSLVSARAKIPRKSVDDWMEIFRTRTLRYLTDQVGALDYNESLPYPDLNMRPALMTVIKEKKAAGEEVKRYKPTYIIEQAETDVKFERQKCGGKGQMILVPVE